MIGQKRLLEKLNKINSLDDLSKSIIVWGAKGIGKHTFAKEVSKKFNIEQEIIDYELSMDILNDMYALSVPKFYLIDFDEISKHKRVERFQNTILKFIEEPPRFAWIIIIVTDLPMMLETIKNRCQIYSFDNYTIEELRLIASNNGKEYDDRMLLLLHTPGNIITKDVSQVNELINLGDMIVNNAGKATPANILTLNNKFFSENPYDLDLFIWLFYDVLFGYYESSDYDRKYYDAIILTKELEYKLRIMNVNKSMLFDNYILRLKECLK